MNKKESGKLGLKIDILKAIINCIEKSEVNVVRHSYITYIGDVANIENTYTKVIHIETLLASLVTLLEKYEFANELKITTENE